MIHKNEITEITQFFNSLTNEKILSFDKPTYKMNFGKN